MTPNEEPTLDDVLNEFVAAYEEPTAKALENWAARYPQFRNDLVDFAASWAAQLVLPPAPELSAEEEKLLVDCAMSHVQNVTFRREQSAADRTENHSINSLIGEAKRVGMDGQEFANACGLDVALVSKLNSRKIRPLSIPARLVSNIAGLLEISVEAVSEFLARPPQALTSMAYLARGKPQSTEQQSFADAVRSSSLGEAEKIRWLDEAAGLDEG